MCHFVKVILLSAAVGHTVAADAVLLAARHALVAASARTNQAFPAKADEEVRFHETFGRSPESSTGPVGKTETTAGE